MTSAGGAGVGHALAVVQIHQIDGVLGLDASAHAVGSTHLERRHPVPVAEHTSTRVSVSLVPPRSTRAL